MNITQKDLDWVRNAELVYVDEKPNKRISKTFAEILKFNPYHGKDGRFASANGSGAAGFTPANTIEEAREYAYKELKINYADYSNCGNDMKTVNMVNKQIYDIYEKYPELKGTLSEITSKPTAQGVMFAAHNNIYDSTLNIGSDCKKGYEELKKSYENNVEYGFHPKGTSIEATIWHEFGHFYEYGHTDTTEEYGNRELSKKWIDEARGNTDSHVFANSISGYATKNSSEAFAEAFAEYNTSKTCRPEAIKLMQAAGIAKKPSYSKEEEEMLRMLGIIS